MNSAENTMEFTVSSVSPTRVSTACLVLPVFEDDDLPPLIDELDPMTSGLIRRLVKEGDISGKNGQHFLLTNTVETIKANRLLFIGLGKKNKITARSFRHAMHQLANFLKQKKLSSAAFYPASTLAPEITAHHTAELLECTFYTTGELKSRNKPQAGKLKLTLLAENRSQAAKLKRGIESGSATAQGVNLARRLGDLPGNICTPTYLAKQAKALSREHKNLKTKVLGEAEMKQLKMNALLSVSAGSRQPAQLIIVEYRKTGRKAGKPIVLVGKGITFDSGGISIKPGAGMDEMKYDMCGAASVLGCMKSLALTAPDLHVIGVIAAAENMPGGNATKPGDIITSMSGQTIEVLNTDAEGRLVLCDALTYCERFKPETVIDIATLTGACVIALGNHAHGLYSNHEKLAHDLLEAGKAAEDKAWHMPLWDEYQKQLASNFADMANIGGRNAGSVTAACFLSRFAKKYHWAHLDIAGTAWNSGNNKGATGRPVPLLMHYLMSKAG